MLLRVLEKLLGACIRSFSKLQPPNFLFMLYLYFTVLHNSMFFIIMTINYFSISVIVKVVY